MEERKRDYGYYNQGSLATQGNQLPEKQTRVVRKKRLVKKVNHDAIKQLKAKMSLMSMVVYLFGLGVVYVIGSSFINSKQTDINKLQTELNNVKKANLLLTEQIEENNDLQVVFTKATSELRMDNPATNQVRYITLPAANYSENLQTMVPEKTKRISLSFR